MIRLAPGIWIGNSADGTNLRANTEVGIRAVLNVAHDLQGECGWPDIEYMQVGLYDGPGNPLSAYYAAVLALATLKVRHKDVLICCHTGGRSLTVAMMYFNVPEMRGWDDWLALFNEKIDLPLPTPNPAHRDAWVKINWRLLARAING